MASLWTNGALANQSAKGATVRVNIEFAPIAVKFGIVTLTALLLCVAANAIGRRFR